MLKNYIKIALRNLLKNKLYSFINIFGLGTAIAICIVGYINFEFSQSFDVFHENGEDVYLITSIREISGNKYVQPATPTPLSPTVKEEIAGIKAYSRLARGNGSFRFNDKIFRENFYYVDDSFFDVFTFPLVDGNTNTFSQKNYIIICEEIAEKYFGTENPIGKQVVINPSGEMEYSFFVGAVIKNPVSSSSLQPEICIPYTRQEDMLGYKLKDWNDWTSAAFIQLAPEVSAAQVTSLINENIEHVNEANPRNPVENFDLLPLLEISGNTHYFAGHPFKNGFHIAQIMAPSLVALLVLFLACFNFVNTNIAFSARRLKEIGVRKVIGGKRSQLIIQYMGENLILSFIALILGLFLAEPFLNFYDGLFPYFSFSLNYSANTDIIIFIVGLLIFTAIAAGAYPAFYVSRFNPVNIFRGNQKLGGTNKFIRVLLTLQFTIAISSILAGIVMYNNTEFIKSFDLGFEKNQVLVVPTNNADELRLLRNSLENHPDVLSLGESQHMPGVSWRRHDVKIENSDVRVQAFYTGKDYFKTNGIKLVSGKSFNQDARAESERSIIINRTMAKEYAQSLAVGDYLQIKNGDTYLDYHIIGIAKDIHLNSVWSKVAPMIIGYAKQENVKYLSILFDKEKAANINRLAKSKWEELFPNLPYDGYFQTEVFAEATDLTASIGTLFIYISLIVIITAGLGLFALVSLNIVRRMKEIGIRRVLGANFSSINYLVSKEFIVLLSISGVLGSVLGYFLVESLLSSIWAYHVGFNIFPGIMSVLIMTTVAFLTIGSQMLKVANTNPVESIRDE